MEANEISLDLEYEKRDENGKLEYEGISFVEDEFPAFLKQTISPIYKDEIVIGNPLILSPGFPPLHTGHATFTASGVPSIKQIS